MTAINECGEPRDFMCHPDTLETGLDLLNKVVAMGHTLLSARLLDQGNQIDLPLGAFDGVSLSAALHDLEKEWNAVLNKPIASTATTQARIDIARWQLETYETRITNYESFTATHTTLLENAQTMQDVWPGARNLRLIQHYQVALGRYRSNS